MTKLSAKPKARTVKAVARTVHATQAEAIATARVVARRSAAQDERDYLAGLAARAKAGGKTIPMAEVHRKLVRGLG